MVSCIMVHIKIVTRLKGGLFVGIILVIILLSTLEDVMALEIHNGQYRLSSKSKVAHSPTSELFEPIEISPSVLPHYPLPNEPFSPLYPTFPHRYDPVLTGKCPVNFTAISDIFDRTAYDCTQPFQVLAANVICCPQVISLIHIFQGYYSTSADKLVLQDSVAHDCVSDIISILDSRGANSTIQTICSLKSSNLTGTSCPVKDLSSFEKIVNTSQLLEACASVDELKECCSPVCQPAIAQAALQLSGGGFIGGGKNVVGGAVSMDALNDCKGVVYSWLARKLQSDAANSAFRALSSCKVNKVCPLDFEQPSEVAKSCRNVAAPSPSCCSSLNAYISGAQRQMLTNRQAIICATTLASMLQEVGVMTNVYELCDVDLKDFSLQGNGTLAFGEQGCLLQSMPTDVVYDNETGYSITCDLNDHTEAPWPLSSAVSSFSLCAEKSLPARPTKQSSAHAGIDRAGFKRLVSIFSLFVIMDAIVH